MVCSVNSYGSGLLAAFSMRDHFGCLAHIHLSRLPHKNLLFSSAEWYVLSVVGWDKHVLDISAYLLKKQKDWMAKM